MLSERTNKILAASVREFIRGGEPISSSLLFKCYDFGIRPAMIRFELNELTEAGYLEQPYHSSGRTPTDRGYEFFAQQVLQEVPSPDAFDHSLFRWFERQAWPELLTQLSDTLGLLGVATDFRHGEVYKDGLDELVSHMQWSRPDIESVIHDFEELDERLTHARSVLDDEDFLKVFVGRKSPVTKSECLSVMAGDYDCNGTRMLLFAIGPKRMDYEKTAAIFKGLKQNQKLKSKD